MLKDFWNGSSPRRAAPHRPEVLRATSRPQGRTPAIIRRPRTGFPAQAGGDDRLPIKTGSGAGLGGLHRRRADNHASTRHSDLRALGYVVEKCSCHKRNRQRGSLRRFSTSRPDALGGQPAYRPVPTFLDYAVRTSPGARSQAPKSSAPEGTSAWPGVAAARSGRLPDEIAARPDASDVGEMIADIEPCSARRSGRRLPLRPVPGDLGWMASTSRRPGSIRPRRAAGRHHRTIEDYRVERQRRPAAPLGAVRSDTGGRFAPGGSRPRRRRCFREGEGLSPPSSTCGPLRPAGRLLGFGRLRAPGALLPPRDRRRATATAEEVLAKMVEDGVQGTRTVEAR